MLRHLISLCFVAYMDCDRQLFYHCFEFCSSYALCTAASAVLVYINIATDTRILGILLLLHQGQSCQADTLLLLYWVSYYRCLCTDLPGLTLPRLWKCNLKHLEYLFVFQILIIWSLHLMFCIVKTSISWILWGLEFTY